MKDKPVILVVDDQPQNIDLLEAYLTPQGYEIVKALNGEEALGKLSVNQIDLILLDVMMPGMDGFELLRRVKQDDAHRLLPIILVTTLRETEDRVKGIEAGCDDFISKPVDRVELLARVSSLLKVKSYNDLLHNYRQELEDEVASRTRELEQAFKAEKEATAGMVKALDDNLKITKTFGRYVSTSVAKTVLHGMEHGELVLEGKEQEITVAFADVRGFTTISEKTPPQELVKYLNIYLSLIIKPVLSYGGMINKFGGDRIMVVWNAPIAQDEHALLAVKAAIAAQLNIKEFQDNNPSLLKMDFGFGINTGKAIAGNMGSSDRLEYSVIGDVVNTASRITDLAPGGKIWIGANSFKKVQGLVCAKTLNSIIVKGKSEPIEVHEVEGIS